MTRDEVLRQATEALAASVAADNTALVRRKRLHEIVKYAHYHLRISQADLAKHLGKHPNTIAKWCAEKD